MRSVEVHGVGLEGEGIYGCVNCVFEVQVQVESEGGSESERGEAGCKTKAAFKLIKVLRRKLIALENIQNFIEILSGAQKDAAAKKYNSGDSLVVTHPTTNPPI